MNCLRGAEINEIANNVRLLSIEEIDDISHYSFDSSIQEYNIFLEVIRNFKGRCPNFSRYSWNEGSTKKETLKIY